MPSLPQSQWKHDKWCSWRSPWDCECRQALTGFHVYMNPGNIPEKQMTAEEIESFDERYERASARRRHELIAEVEALKKRLNEIERQKA